MREEGVGDARAVGVTAAGGKEEADAAVTGVVGCER